MIFVVIKKALVPGSKSRGFNVQIWRSFDCLSSHSQGKLFPPHHLILCLLMMMDLIGRLLLYLITVDIFLSLLFLATYRTGCVEVLTDIYRVSVVIVIWDEMFRYFQKLYVIMDHNRMKANKLYKVCEKWVIQLLEFTKKKTLLTIMWFFWFPYKSCWNTQNHPRDGIFNHLGCGGIIQNYTKWIW